MYDWFSYNSSSSINLDVDSTCGMLEINGTATHQEYMDLLSTVRYLNSLEEPTIEYQEREITVTVRENDQYSMAYIVVELIPVNDPAQFNFTNITITFNEANREPVMLFKSTDIIVDPDQDGGNLSYATLKLWTFVHEADILSIGSISSGSSLNVESNRTHVNISGVAPIKEYEDILKTATFVNKCFDIPSTPRHVIVNTFDGKENSIGPNITIKINPFDDPPLCFFGENIVSKYVYALICINISACFCHIASVIFCRINLLLGRFWSSLNVMMKHCSVEQSFVLEEFLVLISLMWTLMIPFRIVLLP